jgi:hypothetical protein
VLKSGYMKFKATLFIFLLVSSAAQHAAQTTGEIKNLYINDQGLILFKLSSPTSGSPSCDYQGDIWQFKIEPENPFFKEFYSSLLAARIAGDTVFVGHGASCGTG